MHNEKQGITRREFVATSAVAAGALAARVGPAATAPANIKVGLYSITFLGAWYRGEALTLEQVVNRAKEYGYDGIEIDGKRPHGNPLDMPKKRCADLRKYAHDKGIEIAAVAANNDFSSPIPEHREAELVYMRELIRMTADLGVKNLRVFLGWPGITNHPQIASYDISKALWQEAHKKFEPARTWEWCRQGLAESAKYARESGVTLALQNHAPVIDNDRDVLKMIKEVASPSVKACMDVPLFRKKDAAYINEVMKETGALQVLTHFGGEYDKGADGKVKGDDYYLPFARALLANGYNGYIDYELCHNLPVVNGQTAGVEYAEKCAKYAAEFMRGVIAEAKKA